MTRTDGNSSGRRIVRAVPTGMVALALLAVILPVADAQNDPPAAKVLAKFDIDGDGVAWR